MASKRRPGPSWGASDGSMFDPMVVCDPMFEPMLDPMVVCDPMFDPMPLSGTGATGRTWGPCMGRG
jgi:hypothetical protein